ncbi:hypothetical protein [Desulfovibrio sp.]
MTNERQLEQLAIETRSHAYVVPFLPGAGVPDTPEAADRWRAFLDMLSAKTRVGEDPETKQVGILYRQGVWLGDLILADDVKTLFIIPDIREVRGALMARNARVRTRSFTHSLRVDGDLVVHQDILREEPPGIEREGDLALSWPRKVEDLRAAPQRLAAWGVGERSRLRMEEGAFTLSEEREGGAAVFVLRNVDSGRQYVWEFNAWEPVRASELGQEILNQVSARLERFCKLSGLGADFVLKNTKKIGHDIRKMLRYLEFLGTDASAAPEAEALSEVEGILRDLEKNVYGPNPDAPNILIMLDVLSDRLAARVHAVNALPREKRPEAHLQNDLEILAALSAEEVSVDGLFRHPTRAALFFLDALRSDEGRAAVRSALDDFIEAFDAALAAVGAAGDVRLQDILRWPVDTLAALKARGGEGVAAVEDLEFELARLGEVSPKAMLRSVQRAMQASGYAAEGEADLRLLGEMDRFRGSLDSLAQSPEYLLNLVLANFQSPMLENLLRVRESLLGGERDEDVGVRVILARLKTSQPLDFVRFLQRRVNWEHSVVRRFNKNAVPPRRSAAAPSRARTETSQDPRPEILALLIRVCQLGGLGKGFLDPQPAALRAGLEKMRAVIDICAHTTVVAEGDARALKCRALLKDFSNRLKLMEQAARQRDEASLRGVAAALGENYVQALRAALSMDRKRISALELLDDINTLERLRNQELGLDDILGGTDKALFFLNAVLESKAAKREIFQLVKPLNDALAELFKAREGLRLSMADVLRRFERASQNLTVRVVGEEAAGILERMRGLLRQLRAMPLARVLPVLRNAAIAEGGEAGELDAALLERMEGFERGGVSGLGLAPLHVVQLLLAHLGPLAAEEVKALSGRGEFEGKSTPTIISLSLERLRWRESILQAHNTLARR